MKKKNQRTLKNLFLYQTFQKKLIFFILLANIASIIVFYAGVQYFFRVFIQKGTELGIPSYHVFYKFISQLKFEMDIIFLVTTLISTIFIIIGAYIISHKVSGPLYRLREELKSMNKKGKLHYLKFRKKDYMLDIEKEFNELTDKVQND